MLSAEDAEAGIALAGGSLPYPRIRLQFYARNGLPMSAEQLDSIAALMAPEKAQPLRSHQYIGRIFREDDAPARYVRLLLSRLSRPELPRAGARKLKIAVDCANGAASAAAEKLFTELGAEILCIRKTPDGMNINEECGADALSGLIRCIKDNGCDAGFALDGGGGRCIAADSMGEILDGDRLLAILCADRLTRQKADAALPRSESMQNGCAVTHLTNIGFLRYARAQEIPLYVTQSAPEFVLATMRGQGLALGGDSTGYLYFSDMPAADGLMTAGRILRVMQDTGKPLSELGTVMQHDPQVRVSVRIPQKWREIWKNDPQISETIAQKADEMAMDGRVHVRERSEGAVIDILLEGHERARITQYANEIAGVIEQRIAETAEE
jgi:phosphoglucosamine mutase